MKKHLGLALRIAVSAGLLAFAFSRVPLWDKAVLASGDVVEGRVVSMDGREVRLEPRRGGAVRSIPFAEIRGGPAQGIQAGVIPIFGKIRWTGVCLPFVLMGLLNVAVAMRWRSLAGAVGCPIRPRRAYELILIGLFLSMLPLGTAGGDIARAVFVAQNKEDKTKPVLSIFVDRILGILGLLALASGAALASWGDARFAEVRVAVLSVSLCGIGTGVFLVSGKARSLVGWDALVKRLPLRGVLARIDEALAAYRKGWPVLGAALLISVGIHAALVTAHWLLARALSVENASLADFLVLIPVLTTVRAASFMGGLGVSEVATQHLLVVVGIPAAQAMAISLMIFVSNLAWSLPGGVLLLMARHRAAPEPDQAPRS